MSATWPWALLAGLGLYHGLNPAMGWLFAVALGLHRGSRAVVCYALVPLAIGHALAIALAAAAVAALGIAVNPGRLGLLAGGVLVLWALYHAIYRPRHRTRIGMRAGFAGLLLWSFVMAGTHGAGLMVAPALIPICAAAGAANSAGPFAAALLAVAVHMAAMLAAAAAIAMLVYEWCGVGFLRRGWFNLDRLWSAALLATGLALFVTGVAV